MTLNDLADLLRKRLSLPMPGATAHEPMRAFSVGDRRPAFDHKIPPKPGSVLILLYEEGGIIKFPLTKRQQYLGAHSGQISLPGGKTEPGEDAYQTALREGEEEIGIIQQEVSVIGRLSNFFVIPSNFLVTPVIAVANKPPIFHPDAREVERIITAELKDLTKSDAVRQKEILASNEFRMVAPHFELDGEIVWGATAMILNEFRLILQEIVHS